MMVDQSMCADLCCPLKERCHRHKESGREPEYFQLWIPVFWTEDTGCSAFIDYRTVQPADKAVV